jgi:DNA repair protein REV1
MIGKNENVKPIVLSSQEKTQCPASAGLGPNMLIARLATKVAKPNGQHYVPAARASEFMLEQTIRDLPGKKKSLLQTLIR